MAKLKQALRQIVDVAFNTTKVWEEKVGHHQYPVLLPIHCVGNLKFKKKKYHDARQIDNRSGFTKGK